MPLQDLIEFIALLRVVVRARTGIRFSSVEWARGRAVFPSQRPRRVYPTYTAWAQPEISRGRR